MYLQFQCNLTAIEKFKILSSGIDKTCWLYHNDIAWKSGDIAIETSPTILSQSSKFSETLYCLNSDWNSLEHSMSLKWGWIKLDVNLSKQCLKGYSSLPSNWVEGSNILEFRSITAAQATISYMLVSLLNILRMCWLQCLSGLSLQCTIRCRSILSRNILYSEEEKISLCR